MRPNPLSSQRIETPVAWLSSIDGQAAPHAQTLALLDIALATELTGVLRCRHHHFMLSGASERAVAVAFLAHSLGAQRSADAIAGRIVDLGGTPDFAPDSVSRRSCTRYRDDGFMDEMILEAMRAERDAAGFYRTVLDHLGDSDRKTSRLVRSILQSSTSFADELALWPVPAPAPA